MGLSCYDLIPINVLASIMYSHLIRPLFSMLIIMTFASTLFVDCVTIDYTTNQSQLLHGRYINNSKQNGFTILSLEFKDDHCELVKGMRCVEPGTMCIALAPTVLTGQCLYDEESKILYMATSENVIMYEMHFSEQDDDDDHVDGDSRTITLSSIKCADESSLQSISETSLTMINDENNE
jgi:hypothetical protein